MRFVDEAKVYVSAGKGGSGHVGWRREKYIPFGGPDGGDGGNGGAVVFRATPNLNTLIDFSFQPHIRAGNGEPGGPNNLHGATGSDAVCNVPIGTQVMYGDQLVADLDSPGATWVAAKGGRGGKGNSHFKSPTRQAPDFAQPGQDGEAFEFTLILKSIADVGLVGFPNVGKSTLVASVSKAQPRVANYPFTTLRPSLGVALVDKERRLVVADIPGIIEGASEGKGLGIQFLRHIERSFVLAQLIDVSTDERLLAEEVTTERIVACAKQQFDDIDAELRAFSPELASRPRAIVFSKGDLKANQIAYEQTKNEFEARGFPVALICAHTSAGLAELLETLFQLVQTRREESIGCAGSHEE